MKNVIFILLDSLNRHFLPVYGNTWVKAPNIERLARRSVVFDNHYIGSMPCMPARHDIWTGRLEFLWRPWGPVEPGEMTLTKHLKGRAVTQLVTDHYHFFESGGEMYHVDFDGWEFIRGHEGDPWVTRPNKIEMTHNGTEANVRYMRNMSRMREEREFTSPRTFQAAADWIEENHDQHERFYLCIDEFDPHEPFHSSEPYNSMYDPEWDEPIFFWPTYGPNRYSEKDLKHLRAQYAGKLTMADAWLGKLLDKLDRHDLWKDTLVILSTDHGHFLGEHQWVGKGVRPQNQPIAHIPLIAACPGVKPGRCGALTTTVDISATILDTFGVDPGRIDGRSFLPLLRGETESIRDYALYGWFGAYMQITDGTHTYLRTPDSPDNSPLYVYRNAWNTAPWWRIPVPDDRIETGRFMPNEDRVVGRILLTDAEKNNISAHRRLLYQPTQLYNVIQDPGQSHDLTGDRELVARYESLLARALREVSCPPEVFTRLGIDAALARA
ncbi:MAG: sulfatase [Planctomycetes bacterium]|nr:sulfatase [Planctomycetota bacterium]